MMPSTLTRLTLDYVLARDVQDHRRALLGIAEFLGALGNDRHTIDSWLAYSDALPPVDEPRLCAAIETEAIILGAQGRLNSH